MKVTNEILANQLLNPIEIQKESQKESKEAKKSTSNYANIEDVVNIMRENKEAAAVNLSSFKDAVDLLGDIKDNITGAPEEALSAHGLINADSVYSLI